VERKLLVFENVTDNGTKLYESMNFDIYSRSTDTIRIVETKLDKWKPSWD
jgi:hypothetical protein